MTHHILVLSDSLAFHGPSDGELTTEPRLWPNVMARLLSQQGEPTEATIFGRRGWTARDAWFAITRDPHVFSVLLPRSSTVILAVGGMDYLPTILPTHLREGVRLLRPEPVRRVATATFRRAQPHGSKLFDGRWRTLPQSLTDEFLTRSVDGVRYFHPNMRVLGIVPPGHDAPAYGRNIAGHPRAIKASVTWARRAGVEMLRLDEWVAPFIGAPGMNPDGMHWGWDCHHAVGEQAAGLLRGQLIR